MKKKIEARLKELEKGIEVHKTNEVFSHNQVIGMGAAISELKKLLEDKPKDSENGDKA